MGKRAFVVIIFAGLIAATAVTLVTGIWTGDSRWLYTAMFPGILAALNFMFFPLILILVEEKI